MEIEKTNLPALSDAISNYMRALAKKSHAVVKEKYGIDHYKNMQKKSVETRNKNKIQKTATSL